MGPEQLTLVGMLVAGIGSVSTALVQLWKKFEAESKECQEDRKKLWVEIAQLKGQTSVECDPKASKSEIR
jgi:hypothetical protein